jgi:GAF domain-containing protein
MAPLSLPLATAMDQLREGRCGIGKVWEAACLHLSEHLHCTRVSLWLYGPHRDQLHELCLLDARTQRFSSGMTLLASDFAPYFEALGRFSVVDAPQARTHPATACFGDAYFLPADIHSLLDCLVFDADQPVAVICCEHCGHERQWQAQDQNTLAQVAQQVGQAFSWARTFAHV